MAKYPSYDQLSKARTELSPASVRWQLIPSTVDARIAFGKNAPTGLNRPAFNLAEGKARISSVGLDATGDIYMEVTYDDRQLQLIMRLSPNTAASVAGALNNAVTVSEE